MSNFNCKTKAGEILSKSSQVITPIISEAIIEDMEKEFKKNNQTKK